MTRVLITGASGFIGSHLARACLVRGDEVAVLTRPGSSLDRLQGASGIRVFTDGYSDVAAIKRVANAFRPQVVLHTAAQTKFAETDDLADLNASILQNLSTLVAILSALAICDQPPDAFVRTGSIAEYGDIKLPYVETSRENPRNSYGASLVAGTQYIEMAQPRLPFKAVTARLALTYGPGQSEDFFIPHAIGRLLRKAPVFLHRPHDRRDLIHIDDIVEALLLIADAPDKAGSVINVVTGDAPDMAAVARELQVLTGAAPDMVSSAPPKYDPILLVSDPSQMAERYGWSAKIALREGLERTVQWTKQSQQAEMNA
ncbi:NAD-dependent epimerase/dehydratase family protein [Ruegeria faecimaris]|uniref:UDP-glucose 4-epimerase n=1 Tax=Ruegeria faecimaris TaxID=686389 RepID=A0A521CP02_9RHOB|nr:NAD(P)-dependent oxidoreductase [Ruegeria faecimaris]SMO61184.1 UDP-glucose 4-epimerase [Ruegeria faecimaris]